jgi:MinD-like ATPase involved in chromosome partitioning or flagellar assembly
LIRAIRTPVTGNRLISVTSYRQGLGCTTVTAVLGAVLAEQRADRVLAVDGADTTSGAWVPLSHRFYQRLRSPSVDLQTLNSESVREFLVEHTSGLEVLTNDALTDTPHDYSSNAVERRRRVARHVAPYFPVILTDEAGLPRAFTRSGQRPPDGIVIVTTDDILSLDRTRRYMDELAHTGLRLTQNAVVVVNKSRGPLREAAAEEVSRLSERCRGVVVLPFDDYLATTGVLVMDWLTDGTYEMYLRLAALVAEGFTNPGAGSGTPET